MAKCVQQITWHLKKEVLEKMLDNAAGDYSALQFKTCITELGQTKYYMTLIKVDLTAQNVCAGTVTTLSDDEEVCPVPPDCSSNPPQFKQVLENYYERNEITFVLDKNAFFDALK